MKRASTSATLRKAARALDRAADAAAQGWEAPFMCPEHAQAAEAEINCALALVEKARKP